MRWKKGGGLYCFVESVPRAGSFKGKKIIPPSEIPADVNLIIVISSYIEEIKRSLRCAGVDINKCIFSHNGREFDSSSEECIVKFLAVLSEKWKKYIEVRVKKSDYDRYSFIKTDENLYYVSTIRDDIMEEMLCSGRTNSYKQIDSFFELCGKFYKNVIGGYILDCGCNILTTSVYACKKNTKLKSLAFEPNLDVFEMASLNARLNDITGRVTIVNAALSNKTGYMKFERFRHASGSGHLIDSKKNESLNNTIDVQCYSLDAWCRANGFDAEKIKYLWVDVEGWEGFLLDGARDVLKKSPPLFIEFCPDLLKDSGCKDLCISILKQFYDEYVMVDWNGNYDLTQRQPVSNLEELSLRTNLFMIRNQYF